MELERFAFDSPVKVSLFMAHLFRLYLSYKPDSFPFEWLQKTTELEVRCRDTTGEKITVSTSPELLKAIRNCERVNFPNKRGRLPSDWGFSGFMNAAVHQVLDEVPFTKANEFSGPLFSKLGAGIIFDLSTRIVGVRVLYLRDNHWSCMMRDWTYDSQQDENSTDYLLKSETLAVTSIFCRQMNEMIWNPDRERYKARPRYKGGLLTATVVTFICGQVRIVQATLNPSETYPTFSYTLRTMYNLNHDNYDKEAAYDVLKWILSPPDAPMELAVREKK
ncbi:hypothetical protein FQN49_003536 [Arthroderma sp. PD_2]|nr:hypothetical protein FQN49_003536 [Arthroderma sp. PD_2]